MWKMQAVMFAVAVAMIGGCGNKDSSAAGGGGRKGNDWSAVAVETVDVTVDGVAFTIAVPKGLPRHARDAHIWSNDKPEHDSDPKVFTMMMSGSSVKSLDDALNAKMIDAAKAAKLVRKEERPTGYAFTDVADDKHRIEATTLVRAGDKVIACTATQVIEGGPVPSFDASRAMLEKICDSVKPK
jgi:hypothetical protein